MKTQFNNDITKYFSHLNKMIFVYLQYTIFGDFFFFLVYFFLWGFPLPLARSVLMLIIWLFFSFQKSCINKVNCIYVCK